MGSYPFPILFNALFYSTINVGLEGPFEVLFVCELVEFEELFGPASKLG